MAPQSPDPVGLLLAALIATAVVTPLLSLLVLWTYRRAVGRSMRRTAPHRQVPAAPVPAGVPDRPHWRVRPLPVVVIDEARGGNPAPVRGPADDLWRRARRRLHATAAVYAAAGLVFGAVVAAVWLSSGGNAIGPRNLLALTVLFAWPLVPTVLALAASTRPVQALAWIAYALLLLLVTAGTGVTLAEIGMGGQGVLPIPLVYNGWVENVPQEPEFADLTCEQARDGWLMRPPARTVVLEARPEPPDRSATNGRYGPW